MSPNGTGLYIFLILLDSAKDSGVKQISWLNEKEKKTIDEFKEQEGDGKLDKLTVDLN